MGGSKTQVVSAPAQPPAPSASESAESIYQARMKYDPALARAEYELQQEFMPKQAALEAAIYRQYYPEYARSQQALQRELYPQQSQLLEAGASRAAQQLASPFGYTPEEEIALQAIRDRTRQQVVRGIRERQNLGGGLYGGRGAYAEQQGLTELEQAFAQEDINRRLQGGQIAQQAITPYLQILYPQIGAYQPNLSPYQFQSAVPSPDTLYNALYGATRRENIAIPGQPSPVWGLAGSLLGQVGGMGKGAFGWF